MRAGSEDVTFVDADNRPRGGVLDEDDRRTCVEVAVQEGLVCRWQLAPFDSEVRHPSHHQLVLNVVVHVVQDDVGVPVGFGPAT